MQFMCHFSVKAEASASYCLLGSSFSEPFGQQAFSIKSDTTFHCSLKFSAEYFPVAILGCITTFPTPPSLALSYG